jgi:hypothetical protein
MAQTLGEWTRPPSCGEDHGSDGGSPNASPLPGSPALGLPKQTAYVTRAKGRYVDQQRRSEASVAIGGFFILPTLASAG